MRATQLVPLGRTEVRVTRLGLGLAPIGGMFTSVGDETARATVAAAWRLGLRYFDTAPLYGCGLSERRAGAVLAGRPRAEFTLSTKVGRLLVPGEGRGQEFWAEPSGLVPTFDFSAAGVRRSYAESLERLGLDRIDIAYLHDPDDHVGEAITEAYPELARLRAAGEIGAVGAGMNQAPVLTDLVRAVDLDCVMLAGRYTLLDQSGLDTLLPLCRDRGVAVIAAGVYNSGLLADPRPGAPYDYAPADRALLERASAVRAVCDRYGVPLRAAAIQFPLGHPAVTGVVVGARDPDQVADNLAMFEWDIPGELWADLKRVGLLPEEVPTL
ncbi:MULTISPECIES: aldo/keto reductase [unclassified Micromonospora]|uniref:aldo/keto reductase n=1 Tax=unclassified Micromonospora TaxID=2617518 RepID=UPI00104AF5F9|nr:MULTISPECIES: aldo/keto reductase [unclassified Micromonospora]TDB81897.1 aldo/keto reductase [Micromonospora sp. KC721]TDC42039.1 aldo/keto reductase [Micromonospora sp. KC213]